MELDGLFAFFWRDYELLAPDGHRILRLMEDRGERVVNDHVAFRTYDLDPIQLKALARPFEALGYRPSGDYDFPEKKLRARSFLHPEPGRPRVFISELKTAEFSPWLQETVRGLAAAVPAERTATSAIFTTVPSWPAVPHATYQRLLEESEYAGWVSAFGLRVNHFTVSWNDLTTFSSLEAFNAWLLENGVRLNESGGRIKGTPRVLLEQSSTVAHKIAWTFAGGEMREIPSCYYEFARRYPDPATGRLYDGFVAKSADRIFESTDTRHHES
jgi:hypothetical protein